MIFQTGMCPRKGFGNRITDAQMGTGQPRLDVESRRVAQMNCLLVANEKDNR